MENNIDYLISHPHDDCTHISGVLRLEHVSDYDELLKQIIQRILQSQATYILDISRLQYLNSAGITGFAKILILTKSNNKYLHVIGDKNISWQSKFLKSVTLISSNFTIKD